jgi:hypothetical protein
MGVKPVLPVEVSVEGLDKGKDSHDHGPAVCAVAGRPGLAGSGRGSHWSVRMGR